MAPLVVSDSVGASSRDLHISMNTGLRIETFKPDNLVRDRDFNLKHQ